MASWRRSYPRVTFPSCSRHRRNLPVNSTRVFGNELLGETPSITEKMFHVKHSYDENEGGTGAAVLQTNVSRETSQRH